MRFRRLCTLFALVIVLVTSAGCLQRCECHRPFFPFFPRLYYWRHGCWPGCGGCESECCPAPPCDCCGGPPPMAPPPGPLPGPMPLGPAGGLR